MSDAVRSRIQERLAATGKSPRAASIAAKMSPDAIRDIFRRPDNSVTLETIRKLAVGLETTPEWLAFGGIPEVQDQAVGTAVPAGRAFVPIRSSGPVQAGAFLQVEQFNDLEQEAEIISAPRDPEFPFARQRAYGLRGDSMNAAEPPLLDGGFIITVNFEDAGLEPTTEMLVVVRRTLYDGQIQERSVKELHVFDDRIEYRPKSTNPIHKPIVVPRVPDPDTTEVVEITDLVRLFIPSVPIPVGARRR